MFTCTSTSITLSSSCFSELSPKHLSTWNTLPTYVWLSTQSTPLQITTPISASSSAQSFSSSSAGPSFTSSPPQVQLNRGTSTGTAAPSSTATPSSFPTLPDYATATIQESSYTAPSSSLQQQMRSSWLWTSMSTRPLMPERWLWTSMSTRQLMPEMASWLWLSTILTSKTRLRGNFNKLYLFIHKLIEKQLQLLRIQFWLFLFISQVLKSLSDY